MFGYNNNPLSVAGLSHRILYMNTAGKVGFGFNTGTGHTSLSSSAFNDGNWHWAFVTMTVTGILGIGAVSSITLYVDGSPVATGGGLLVGISGDTGYWPVDHQGARRPTPRRTDRHCTADPSGLHNSVIRSLT